MKKEKKGIYIQVENLRPMVTAYNVMDRSILNSNIECVALLTDSLLQPKQNESLKNEYGVGSNSFALAMVRLVAFSQLKKDGWNFHWYQNPLLGNVD